MYLEIGKKELEYQNYASTEGLPEKLEESVDTPVAMEPRDWKKFVRLLRTSHDNWEADRREYVLSKKGIWRRFWAYVRFEQTDEQFWVSRRRDSRFCP